jgi:hypothetical protein
MDGIKRGGDRQIGKTVSVDKTIKRSTAHLKQRPACLKACCAWQSIIIR